MKKKRLSLKQKLQLMNIDKTKALKWVIIGFGIALLSTWIAWFTIDCMFISKGIHFWDATGEVWNWDTDWYHRASIPAIITLSISGAYISLMVAYMVICGLNIRSNMKHYVYQLIVTAASFITLTICIIKAAEMMVNEQYVIDIRVAVSPLIEFKVYHLDFLKWMSIVAGCAIFTDVLMLRSFKPIERDTLIKDCNLLVLVLAAAQLVLFIPFFMTLGWNDPIIGGAGGIGEWIDLIENSITWKHVVCQCVTSPMGVFAGMVMVLVVIRFISVIFAYNKRWVEKKSHMIVFGIIGFLVFAAFIVAHANKLDFEKLLNDYNSMKLGILLVVLAQTVTCTAAGTYSLISMKQYKKRAA